MRALKRTFIILVALGLSGVLVTASDELSDFERISTHYENIRQALLHDTIDGAAEQAEHIRHVADSLRAAAGGHDHGGDSGGASVNEILDSIREATNRVAAAEDIKDMRVAFGSLSKRMVQYRRLSEEPASVVAFCSMSQQVWLQPPGELGNPYYGQSMPGCGESSPSRLPP